MFTIVLCYTLQTYRPMHLPWHGLGPPPGGGDAFARRMAGDGRISPDFMTPGILAQSVLFIYRMRMQNNSCLDSVVSMKDVSAI